MLQYIDNIKQHYEEITPRIISRNKGQWVAPYTDLVDWVRIFSPIEEMTWQSLRCFGHCPLYPQYPVGKYFLDFANPKHKIAIECDGKEWHLDKDKDAKRDIELLELGWTIFRISGSDCYKVCEEYHDRFDYDKDESEVCEILREYYNTVDGLIKAISMFYFEYKEYVFFEREIEIAYQCLQRYLSPAQFDKKSIILSKKYNACWDEYSDYSREKDNAYDRY